MFPTIIAMKDVYHHTQTFLLWYGIVNFVSGLASHHDLPDLYLLSSQDDMYEPLVPGAELWFITILYIRNLSLR
jgi:hypothetical protein